ncbi:HNH endonuclease [Halalkalibacter flavus]|uniref:HNH endonuclease n=1 Tax=Halalkalibacter flavus TaxID=3090668 RepID=UPI002FC59A59
MIKCLTGFETLPIGTMITADTVAHLSGQNRVKAIHPLKVNDRIKAVVILCTIGGENYPNEWLDDKMNLLKYYLEGRTDKVTGLKKYNENIVTIKAIIESGIGAYPIYVFTRNKKGIPFKFEGEFLYNGISTDENGIDKYFELRRDVSVTTSEIEKEEYYFETTKEGRRVLRQHFARERDSRIIQAAKDRYMNKNGTLKCEACDFDFYKTYGERGQGYIEGHHNIPVSELEEDGGETSIDDIALVCSNCHKMIHRYRPWLSVGDLKAIIKR